LEEGAQGHLYGALDPLAHPSAEGIFVTRYLNGDGGHNVFGDGGQHPPQSRNDQVIQYQAGDLPTVVLDSFVH
jgi:hypothetical protein